MCLVDNGGENYMVDIGPSAAYAWRNRKGTMEMHMGLQIPLLFKGDYEHDHHDDFPTSGGFVAITLIWMAQTFGIFWTF